MINYIWGFLIIFGVLYFFLTGDISGLNNEIMLNSQKALKLIIDITPSIVLWSGLMRIAEDSGLLNKFARLLNPILKRLFPTIKKDSAALGYISSNIAANMLGLGSAATPFGLKAMSKLQEENDNKKEASSAMITFLVLNTAGVTLIPTTVIAMRTIYKSFNPSSIIIPSIIATMMASIAGLALDCFIRRKSR